MLGYQIIRLTFRVGDQTLFANTTSQFIQVDRDKLLYIDGSSSYDLFANISAPFNYTWRVDGFPNVVLP